ncbi:hypothetical protein BACSTE_01139 [Bacteroides stercoris ATCC 43183]|uniref:Uncharacterized protein n=1 Tax=Bacteroides stercoris ATCC 43183 TaxID=449673 RepID=B0NP22_BACSE|nr:hypothetical protein BACSTE_01139 [Bacteroides stercoris ATCC 43183]
MIPLSTASATSAEVREPLNESGATTIFFMLFNLYYIYNVATKL